MQQCYFAEKKKKNYQSAKSQFVSVLGEASAGTSGKCEVRNWGAMMFFFLINVNGVGIRWEPSVLDATVVEAKDLAISLKKNNNNEKKKKKLITTISKLIIKSAASFRLFD